MAKLVHHKTVYKKNRNWFKILLKIFLVFLAIIFFGFVLFLVYSLNDLPRPEKFAEGDIPQSTKVYDRTGKTLLLEISGKERRTIVPLSQIPMKLREAVLTAEDKSFYQHKGLDFKAILRAILADLKLGKPLEGGSTISQQLIRSYFLTRNKTLKRKTREVILTLELERKYTKEQILEWYLNIIPFGGNIYGVETASEVFFHKKVSDISLSESAVLAALIRSPSYLSPYGEHLERLQQIKNYILKGMKKAGYITESQEKEALEEKIKFFKNVNIIKAPHFSLMVKRKLEEMYSKDFLEKAGLKVYTTLNWDFQEKAEKLIEEGVKYNKRFDAHNGALVALNPKNGEVLALVGSKNWYGESEDCGKEGCKFDPKVNITTSLRQPGSAFKPFAYATFLQKGFTPNTLLWDVKTEFNPNCSPSAEELTDKYGIKCYHPKNYDGRFKGLIKAKEALAQSRNVPSVKVLYLAGEKNTLELAKNLGITTLKNPLKYGLSLVLGGGEVTLLDITSAYGVFGRDGNRTFPHFIYKIEDSKGNILFKEKNSSIKVLESNVAREISQILSSNNLRAPMFGINSPLYIKGYQVAVKTGTTQKYNDAWIIGYTPSISVGVWIGNNNNAPMKGPGVTLAGPIWHEFMEFALKNFKKESFEKPKETLVEKPILNGKTNNLKPHCILYYLNKKDPLGKENSKDDIQFKNWEYAVLKFNQEKK